MSDERWVLLGLAHPRATWFSELSRWSTTAALPVEFIKCVSADEVRARLLSGRTFSALLVGGDVAALDRDLVAEASEAGVVVLVVDPRADRDWTELGVTALLAPVFERGELLSALREHATPVTRVTTLCPAHAAEPDSPWRGHLLAVTGPGGTGSSVTAMAIAQAFAAEPSNAGMVLLADLALDAEQGMLHDAREVVPGIQELVEAHRAGRPPIDQTRAMAFDAGGRGYHLLLGLRRHRDWTAVRPRAFEATLDGMLRAYRVVVADVDADLEGEDLTGSLDIENRNAMARATISRADVVVAVGNPTTKGLHALGRLIRDLIASDVDPERLVPFLTRAPRNPRRRAAAVAALAPLLGTADTATAVGNPVFASERGDVEDALRDGVRLPPALGKSLRVAIVDRLAALDARPVASPSPMEPERIIPGSLATWTEETA